MNTALQEIINAINETLRLLAEAPETQIDSTVTPKFLELVDQPPAVISAELKIILNECAYASLASDFAMQAMMNVRSLAKTAIPLFENNQRTH